MIEKLDYVADNFIPYTYGDSLKILQSISASENGEKVLVLVVGANGSGKSTFIANWFTLSNPKMQYVNADLMLVNSGVGNAYTTMEKTIDYVYDLINNNKSFIYETVFSHLSKLEIANYAKNKGYKIIAVYVKTNDVNININRVAKRVSQGGHNVSEDKIISRFNRVIENVKKLKKISDEFYEFDNSFDI